MKHLALLCCAALLTSCAPAVPPSNESVPSPGSSVPTTSAPTTDMPVPGLGDASSVEETVVTEDAMEKATEDAGGSGDGAAMAKPAARTVRITASNWQFTPSTITVKKGEQVTLEVVGSEGIHGFAIRELGINVGVDLGNTVSIVLPTSTPGTYAFFCSVPCGEGHKDMKGTIIIGE